MPDSISIIRDSVRAEIARGTLIDVDMLCRVLGPLCPEIPHKQLETEILQVVCSYGGNASWGQSSPADQDRAQSEQETTRTRDCSG
jgi:hypothetical protein